MHYYDNDNNFSLLKSKTSKQSQGKQNGSKYTSKHIRISLEKKINSNKIKNK